MRNVASPREEHIARQPCHQYCTTEYCGCSGWVRRHATPRRRQRHKPSPTYDHWSIAATAAVSRPRTICFHVPHNMPASLFHFPVLRNSPRQWLLVKHYDWTGTLCTAADNTNLSQLIIANLNANKYNRRQHYKFSFDLYLHNIGKYLQNAEMM